MRVLISVCTARDINIWTVSHLKILENIKSDRYVVIVPARDVKLFESVTHGLVEIVDEDSVGEGLRSALESSIVKNISGRFGWYYQQLLKLAFLSENLIYDEFIIWDADTLPVREIDFFKGEIVFYYQGSEYHPPYFNQIKRSLNLERFGDFSFIAQNIALKAVWAQSYFSYLESVAFKRGYSNWITYLVSTIDFNEESGFSEYESLGTYIKKNHPRLFLPNKRRWFRYGSEFFELDNLKGIFFRVMVFRFDYVAFESWKIERSIMSKIVLYIRAVLASHSN